LGPEDRVFNFAIKFVTVFIRAAIPAQDFCDTRCLDPRHDWI
jgi:hypothetical protein